MSELISGGDNSPEQQPAVFELTLEEVGEEVFVAAPDSEVYASLDDRERLWLNAFGYSREGASLQDVLPESEEKSIKTFTEYSHARDSLMEKVNDIFGCRVLQVIPTPEGDVLQNVPDTKLINRYQPDYTDMPAKPIYGHPSMLAQMGTQALLEMNGGGGDIVDWTDAESRMHKRIAHHQEVAYGGLRREFSRRNPLPAAAIYDQLKQTYPYARKEDVDWMADAQCIGANQGTFASRRKKDINHAKQYCENCSVQQSCHEFAVRNDVRKGVWGGGDEKERRDKEFTASVQRVRADVEARWGEEVHERRQRIATETARWLQQHMQNPENSLLKTAQMPVFQALAKHCSREVDNPDGFIAMPTGTGKTVLFIEAVRAAGLKTTILVPTRPLVHQTVGEFERFHAEGDVGKIYSDEKQSGKDITVTTYDSFRRHVTDRNGMFSPEDIDILVLDEAHRALSKRNNELLSSMEHVLKIGFTATDEYDHSKTLSNTLPNEIYRMGVPEAIDAELISPYQTILFDTNADLSEVRISPSTKDFVEQELADAVDSPYRNQLAAELYTQHFRGEKGVFFCVSVEHARSVAAELQERGVRAEAVDGGQSETRKQRIIESHKTPIAEGGLEVVCNAKLLAEGWDNPAVSVCFNMAPTLSKVRAKQRSGRILRFDNDNADKVAAIVEFLDQNYRRPPVTFADLEVAEEAAYFPGDVMEQARLRSLPEPGIMADPSEVGSRAYEMHVARRLDEGVPPHDWSTQEAIICAAMQETGFIDESFNEEQAMIFAIQHGILAYRRIHECLEQVRREMPDSWSYSAALRTSMFSPQATEELYVAVLQKLNRGGNE